MLAWLADQANVFYFVLGTAILALLAAGWLTRRPKYWGYAAGAVGLCFLVWLLTKLIVTDRQQILLNLDAMARATERQKADDLFEHISKDFRFGTMNRDDLFNRVKAAMQIHKVSDIQLRSQQVVVKGDAGEVLFNFRAEAAAGGVFAASAKAIFAREAGQWKLVELQVFRLGTTDRQHIPGVD
jgi:hypothetical protein